MLRMIALSCVLWLPMTAFAQDLAQDPVKETAAQKLASLNKEYSEANRKYREELAKIKDRKERYAFMGKKNPVNQFAQKFLALAEESPKDPAVFKALLFVLRSRSYPAMQKALKILSAHHVRHKDIKDTFWSASRIVGSADFFRKVMKDNKERETVGAATFMLASFLVRSRKKEELAEAEALYKTINENYADVFFGRGKLGTQAKNALFKLTNLKIGSVAPDIEGEDVDGKKFKLSDYRGKIVVLDFWGDW